MKQNNKVLEIRKKYQIDSNGNGNNNVNNANSYITLRPTQKLGVVPRIQF